jgi:hypothetical protein
LRDQSKGLVTFLIRRGAGVHLLDQIGEPFSFFIGEVRLISVG